MLHDLGRVAISTIPNKNIARCMFSVSNIARPNYVGWEQCATTTDSVYVRYQYMSYVLFVK